jgi:hypothetical protein
MGINVDDINKQLENEFDQEVKRRETEIELLKKENDFSELAIISNNMTNISSKWRILDLKKDLNKFDQRAETLNNDLENIKKDSTKKVLSSTTSLTLSNFLQNLNEYPSLSTETSWKYKGVLINSFYELEFHFPYADENINNILRCRCVSIGTPNIRKNYTSLNFNGRRVEIEQNAEFQHDIQIRIICDEDADIYYKFKEYIDCTKNKKPLEIFNGSFVWICLNGYYVIKLNNITISDLGQLEFDNSPGSNICYFNVTLKIIDYDFYTNIELKNNYDKKIEEILNNKQSIKDTYDKIKNLEDANKVRLETNYYEAQKIEKTNELIEILEAELQTLINGGV